MIAEGFKAITGEDIASFSLYFIESERPHLARATLAYADQAATQL
jgi:hypothetical protein